MNEDIKEAVHNCENDDPCLLFVSQIVLKTMKMKPDKWIKMMSIDEYKQIVLEWKQSLNKIILIITLTPTGALCPKLDFPFSTRGKSCYFIKKSSIELNADNYDSMILYGDIATQTLDYMTTLLEDVFSPLLIFPENHFKWPKSLRNDVLEKFHELLETVLVIKGKINNRTFLPKPINMKEVIEIGPDIIAGKIVCDLKMQNILEGVVIKWSLLINEIIIDTSEKLFDMNTTSPSIPLPSPPMPLDEYSFWNMRYLNLSNLYTQLTDYGRKMIGLILEAINSVYFDAFKQAFQNIVTSLAQARDVQIYLNALEPLTKSFETVYFHECRPHVKPLLHCMCIMWAHSKYYTSINWVTLFKMIANMLIEESNRNLDSIALFQSDIEDGLLKISETISIFEYYKEQVIEHKRKLMQYKIDETYPNIVWTFKTSVIFERLDLYVNRLKNIRDMFDTANDFLKLEKLEIGGIRGRHLNQKLSVIQNEFQLLFNTCTTIDFNPLDPNDGRFNALKMKYDAKSKALERRLAQILVEAFENSYSTESRFKLVEMIGKIAFRPIIHEEISRQLTLITESFIHDIDTVERHFQENYDNFLENGIETLLPTRGYPPMAGAIHFFQKLRLRLEQVSDIIPFLEYPIFTSKDGELALSRKQGLAEKIRNVELEILQSWFGQIECDIKVNMCKPLIIRTNENLLKLNFDQKLIVALKECSIITRMEYEILSDIANNFFKSNNMLWEARVFLSYIVERYNYIHTKTRKCEFNIIFHQLGEIDACLNTVISEYTWINYDINHIKKCHEMVSNLYGRVKKAQENVQNVLNSIKVWANVPFYRRKEGGSGYSLLDIDDRHNNCKNRAIEVNNSKKLIEYAMEENYRLFFNMPLLKQTSIYDTDGKNRLKRTVFKQLERYPSRINKNLRLANVFLNIPAEELAKTVEAQTRNEIVKTEENLKLYRPYEEYIDELVSEALMKSVLLSLSYISNAMIANDENSALFKIYLEFYDNKLVYSPSLNKDEKNNFMQIIDDIMMDISMVAEQINRVAQPESQTGIQVTYAENLHQNEEIIQLKKIIKRQIEIAIDDCVEYLAKFKNYDYIWLEDKDVYLKQFIEEWPKSNLHEEEEDIQCESDLKLESFQNQIEKWINMFDEFEKLDNYHLIQSWLLIDLRSFKHTILNQCSKWGNVFKDHLLNYVLGCLDEFENFIDCSNNVLSLSLHWDDLNTLLRILSALNQIKERETSVDHLFESLKKIIYMLMQYNVTVPRKCTIQFSDLPEKWITLRKTAVNVKYKIVAIQTYQVDMIHKRITYFNQQTLHFRDTFQKIEFFYVPCPNPYDLCDKHHLELKSLEKQFNNLMESASIFEINPPNNQALLLCRNEIRFVKQLWDFVNVIESCVSSWKKTAWKKLDVEEIEQQCKKFSKDIRMLGKIVRPWEPFIHIEKLLKNLVTSLRAITELQNPAIKDRHWLELMKSTGLFAKFGMLYLLNIRLNKSTTLFDLLNLGLHEFEDEVKHIVDKAVKETSMEKILNDIANQWSNLNFEYEFHARSGLKLVKVSESLIEKLEENQVQIQNMATSKYTTFFENEIKDWASKLSMADLIITTWTEVQRKWLYLESIFLDSQDIRKQLPVDSERFLNANVMFKFILNELTTESNVMNIAFGQPELNEKMENILTELILCEKALNDYLETKRLIYPRFYFISSTDLLDILSKGNDPEAVGKHLTKLYDSIKKLKYNSDNTRALGMYSKEHNEYVEFVTECDCTGKVEDWLNRVTDVMRFTLNRYFAQSIDVYEDKSRDNWLFDWPAQVALCITQIWWSIEVNEVFGKIEEGYENALKDYQKKQVSQLNALINLLLGDLNGGDRQKIMTICTIDVHSRDVVSKMIAEKVTNVSAFQWQSQLRHRWDRLENDCYVNICDAEFKYDYEYLGISPRLVITPLTDRCYITLTQSLQHFYGGAPSGPVNIVYIIVSDMVGTLDIIVSFEIQSQK